MKYIYAFTFFLLIGNQIYAQKNQNFSFEYEVDNPDFTYTLTGSLSKGYLNVRYTHYNDTQEALYQLTQKHDLDNALLLVLH